MDDFDDLLPWLNALDDLLPDRLRPHALDKIPRDFEIDVSLKQCQTYFAESVSSVGLGNLAEPAQIFKGVLQLSAELIKHCGKLGHAEQVDKTVAASLDSPL